MRYLTAITRTDPLTISFSFYNPHESEEAVRVPLLLTPLGAFVRVEVLDGRGRVVYRSRRPKMKLKLDPSKPASYLTLETGYTYGATLVVEDLRLTPGEYRLRLAYSNLPYSGPEDDPLGELRHEAEVAFRVGGRPA